MNTIEGGALYPINNRLDRLEALRLYTVGSSWFSSDEGKKGSIVAGQLADLAVLSADYFSIPEEQIKQLESVLTIVGGKVVYAAKEFFQLAPPPLPVWPDWSPVKTYGGYWPADSKTTESAGLSHAMLSAQSRAAHHRESLEWSPWWFGCGCFV
jgi:Amidohydrolase family